MLVYLFGGWERQGNMYGTAFSMRFLTYRRAEAYGKSGISVIDPYARFLSRKIVAVPGQLIRRTV